MEASSSSIPLVPKPEGPLSLCGASSETVEEIKRQLWLAGPLIAVSVLQYLLQVISVMFVGHLGELALSGASMATSFAAVTGLSVLLGMGSALETLCGQAYGAKQYHMLGVHTQRAMLVLVTLSIPIGMIWFYTSSILIALGQDPEISAEAGVFIRWMIPSLFAYAILQCQNRFLQTQNNVIPLMAFSGFTAFLHVFLCWGLVFGSGLGSRGAALANTISNWVNVVFLAAYVKFSPACSETWTGFSREGLRDVVGFVKLAVPSAVMICFEYWSFEMVVLGSGFLPNPKLETSVLSIRSRRSHKVSYATDSIRILKNLNISNIDHFLYSTRVSNELGAGHAEGARLALHVMIVMAISIGAIIGIATISARHVWGKLYSDEEEVVTYVAKMMPLLALSDFLDGFQCVLSGAARGCGWQNICAVINLVAYYVVGIPSAVLLAFVFHLRGMGQWMGIICALSVQTVALLILNAITNWDIEERRVQSRFENSSHVGP